MTPKSPAERALQQAVIGLAKDHPFARAFVNSGRLSVPCHQRASSLTTPDEHEFAAALQPGDVCLDAPLASADGRRWLLEHLGGRFVCLYFMDAHTPAPATVAATLPAGVALLPVSREARADAAHDDTGVLSARYDARPGTTCLIRPDQHLAARWRQPDPPRIAAALRRATATSFTQN
jgi:3-(3-hydroxy-phenyl)propionate hydroxylase